MLIARIFGYRLLLLTYASPRRRFACVIKRVPANACTSRTCYHHNTRLCHARTHSSACRPAPPSLVCRLSRRHGACCLRPLAAPLRHAGRQRTFCLVDGGLPRSDVGWASGLLLTWRTDVRLHATCWITARLPGWALGSECYRTLAASRTHKNLSPALSLPRRLSSTISYRIPCGGGAWPCRCADAYLNGWASSRWTYVLLRVMAHSRNTAALWALTLQRLCTWCNTPPATCRAGGTAGLRLGGFGFSHLTPYLNVPVARRWTTRLSQHTFYLYSPSTPTCRPYRRLRWRWAERF